MTFSRHHTQPPARRVDAGAVPAAPDSASTYVRASEFRPPASVEESDTNIELLERYVARLRDRARAGNASPQAQDALHAYERVLGEQRLYRERLFAAPASTVDALHVVGGMRMPVYREPETYAEAQTQARAYLAARRAVEGELAAVGRDTARHAALVRLLSRIDGEQRQASEDVRALGMEERRGITRERAGELRRAAWELLAVLERDHPALTRLPEAAALAESAGACEDDRSAA